MPRLGTDGGGEDDVSGRRQAVAYPRGNLGPLIILTAMAAIIILRNLLSRDYRNEMVSQLQSLGQTSEQIEKLLPKTIKERAELEKAKESRLHEDVEYLLAAVYELQLKAGLATRNSTTAPPPPDPSF